MSTNLLCVVSPGYKFEPASDVQYACRVPCFSNLKKTVKHHIALQGLLESLRSHPTPIPPPPVNLIPCTTSSLSGTPPSMSTTMVNVSESQQTPCTSHTPLDLVSSPAPSSSSGSWCVQNSTKVPIRLFWLYEIITDRLTTYFQLESMSTSSEQGSETDMDVQSEVSVNKSVLPVLLV